ncbi:MAG: DUF3794 domain-containing protein [Oscillospiraceae bacterium]|nr:DUF3794 domain-containing protein [Oscillospiraceae bacterium]
MKGTREIVPARERGGSRIACVMDLKTTKEPVFLGEAVYDGKVEQGVEFDYVLPDYYPDIFKVLKCSLTPCIISHSISGNQLYCDGVVYIKVLYLSRDNNLINCIEQRYTYSKTIDLMKDKFGEILGDNAVVHITPKTDYCNCRAISGRRIDVRGAVSCKVKVNSARETGMITGASGMGVEARKIALNYCGEKLTASRQFVIREDIETGVGGNGINNIIHHDAFVSVTDYKIVANKIIIKGEASIKALYLKKTTQTESVSAYENDDETSEFSAPEHREEAEVMEAVVPISQIIDLNGISEDHVCYVNMTMMDCNLEIKSGDGDGAGENRILSCDLTLGCTVTAHLEKEVMPLIDMYSVDYESSFTKTVIRTEAMPKIIERQLSLKGVVECDEANDTGGNLEEVYDSRCDINSVVCRIRDKSDSDGAEGSEADAGHSDNQLIITGQATLQVIGRLDNNAPVYIEKTEAFELITSVESVFRDADSEYSIESNLQVVNTTYSVSGSNQVELRVVLKLGACLYQMRSIEVIKEISINRDAPKQKDNEFALKLYYAEANEEVWDIAKRYNTGAAAIIAENDMESNLEEDTAKVTNPCMLLIPIV